ncbi:MULTISPECIES: sugar transferase [Photorhabdus]|uniref:sugar transferase n=2 Tax=Morganellaceae TaxID=1903414 RepID=UPI000DCD0EAB|nr:MULTISPECIES: sugar transferase [Photorhabdus]AXG45036.1 glycosyl transferase [Photorhabdus laumondii subsp. laumondii]NDL15782.1 sugar transferase [Photorhabdus laumondii subsp. laumondii]NDL47547.1 sugar transferase [Photorhabdus laumondii subsp. laumondii]NDL53453.1 sugar transferase [Photorhabdus laumondii subsp. laumondii]RAW87090.1 glycosyl transferase [Photorhabdus sp. S5P8-50]
MMTYYLAIKRLFDFTSSLIGLILLLPILITIAIWIKIDSKGPIFFRQKRVGQYNQDFYIHKFRSMTTGSEQKGQLTIGHDLRITHSGKFIRKYKIDELAQLIDVVRGKMSLVGPRPEVPQFMDKYPDDVRNKILSVKPGITDLASIEMIDENQILSQYKDPHQAYIDIIMPIKAKYYLEYIDKKSFFYDLKIIFKTIYKVVFR